MLTSARAENEGVRPAELPRRAVAVLLDSLLVLFAVALPFALASGHASRNQQLPNGKTGAGITLDDHQLGFVLLIGLLYTIVAEATLGATLGKFVLGLRVRRVDVGWGGAAARNILRVVDAFPYVVPYGLGWAIALADAPQRRRLGDRAAHSVVVSTRSSSSIR